MTVHKGKECLPLIEYIWCVVRVTCVSVIQSMFGFETEPLMVDLSLCCLIRREGSLKCLSSKTDHVSFSILLEANEMLE